MWEMLNENVFGTWISGGPLMIALAVLAFVIYGTVMQVLFYLRSYKELRQDSNAWGHWVERPEDGEGMVGDMIRYSQRDLASKEDFKLRFEILHSKILNPLDRQIRLGTIIVGAAPLLGLLGTVIGMLATFLGLSVSYGGNSLDLVAGGISEALITTQTGLVLAIPAMFFLVLARSQRQSLYHFLVELEARTLGVLEEKNIQ